MGRISFDKKSGAKRFFSGKGFYIALAVCLVAVCGVGVVTFLDSMPKTPAKNNSSTVVTSPSTATTTAKPVDNPVTNIPDNRTTLAPTAPNTTVRTTVDDIPTGTDPKDLFVLPLSNEVLRAFSDGKQVYSATMNDWRTHNGVDFKGTKGQKVKAAADGTVKSILSDPLWGSVVVLDHGNGVISRYCGVSVSTLKEGQSVKAGDEIGALADIPCEIVDGPHLHIEFIVNDEYQDPIKAIGREVKYADTATTAAPAATTTGSK